MSRLLKYWKQFTAVAVLSIGAVIAVNIIMAASVTVTIEQSVTGIWTVGQTENWSATAEGDIDDVPVSSEKVYWSTSDSQIVSVTTASSDDKGNYGAGAQLIAKGAGRATVKAYYLDSAGNIIATTSRTIQVGFSITNKPADTPVWSVGDNGTYWTNYISQQEPLQWTSSDEDVIEIDDALTEGQQGSIRAVGAGSATITVKTPDGQTDSFDVVVKAAVISTEQIRISPTQQYDLFTNTNAKKPTDLLWYSENESIASVDMFGTVTGAGAGVIKVYCYPNYDYSQHSIYSTYTEAQLAAALGQYMEIRVNFGIANGNITMTVGDIAELRANTDSRGVNWTSDNTSVCTVDSNGNVTALKAGTCNIRATLDSFTLFPGENVQSGTIAVTVVDGFSLNKTEEIINIGDTFELSALVTDTTATVSWMSGDESVADITYDPDNNYKVTITGKGKGNTVITAIQTINGVKKKAQCQVSVNNPVQNVELYPTKLEIDKGADYPLVLKFIPELPDNMSVLWVSSDESIATVNQSGVVTGVNGGDCTISVISVDGIKVASCALHVRVPVTGITMSRTRVEASLSVGNYQLSYTITPSGAGVNQNVIWESSNPAVATVDQNGFVTFVSPGKATIIAQTVDTGTDGSLIATCEFYINDPVVSVSIDYNDVTLKIGDTFRLTAEVLPSTATDKSVTWISSNTNVVTIDENGLLTAVGSGNAAILCQSNDSGVTAMCNVSVYQAVENIELSITSISVRKGTIFWIYGAAKPDNAVNKTIVWSSSDESIATVDQTGMVTAVSPGECSIIATSEDSGVISKCILTVTEPVTGIELNYTQMEMMKGDQFLLIPTITPIDADNKSVTFTSTDETVATVSDQGVVTGVKGGNCIIIVTTVERGLIASCQVVVNEFVTSIKIDSTGPYLNKGNSRYLTAKLIPDSATNKGVVWSSSDKNILTVDNKGKITGVNYGEAIVTATAADGSGLFDTVKIRVIKPVSTITVSPATVTVLEGKETTVKAAVSPSDASIRGITWSSSNPEIASVDFNGTIYGVKAGVCYVYATSEDGNEIVGTCKVTVRKAVPATTVRINSSKVVLLPGQTRELSVRLSPANSTDGVRWVSDDTSVATVDKNGNIKAKGQGNCAIYCVSDSGVESSCEIIVLALNSSNITLEQYDTYTLDVFGATENIKWYTNNPRIATVNGNGVVTARGTGVTTITAKVNGKVLYAKVTVKKINR